MMKKLLYSIILFVCILLTGCGSGEYDLEQEEIVFIYQWLSYDGPMQNRGFFIDNEGNRYDFDLSEQKNECAGATDLYEYLHEHKDSYTGKSYLSQKELKQWYSHLCQVDPEAELKTSMSISGGGDVCYGIRKKSNGDAEIILIVGTCAWGVENMDASAQTLAELFLEKKMATD